MLEKYKEHITKSLSSKKRFDYNTIIVSLYGYLEQFIESLVIAYLNSLNRIIPEYSNLPQPITKHHIDLSFGLLSRREYQNFHTGIDSDQIISKLHSCFNKAESYKINALAFSQHTANFRTDVIDEIFNRIGIKYISNTICGNPIFQKFLQEKYPDRKIEKINSSEVYYYINDLAERRNEVAHGMPPDEILSKDILLDYIVFFENYSKALYDTVKRSILPFIASYHGIELGKPIIVHNNSIVCMNVKDIKIEVGDTLIAKPRKRSQLLLKGKIQELQIDGKEHEKIEAKSKIDIAIRVKFKVKDNQTFYLVAADNDFL